MPIPKIIHYCWVGGKPKPRSVQYCIESWRRACPDYEIVEWNESNYDFKKNKYMREAYEAEKWGFVPDYARLDIIYEHGGVYLDTDVELLKPIDKLLENDAFAGFENTGDGEYFVNFGQGFGAAAGNDVIRSARDMYDSMSFLNADGTPSLLASPHFTTECLVSFGLVRENRDQSLDDIKIYASDVLCPKCFRTGKTKKSARTVSIHHFEASWVDEKLKRDMAHQQKLKRVLGECLGGRALYIESVIKKYTFRELTAKVLLLIKQRVIRFKDAVPYYVGLFKLRTVRRGNGSPVMLDTALESDNSGDQIIMESCMSHISGADKLYCVPTHRFPTDDERMLLRCASEKLLCGTNILSGHMRSYGLWRLSSDVSCYRNTRLMGVGFDSKNEDFDTYTRQLLRGILSKSGYHSVRDSFSEKMLRKMGIDNVLNTGCPTMWNLTPEHCETIPKNKAASVVCTVTDYSRDDVHDADMLRILTESYDTVYLWLQGSKDREYVEDLGFADKVTFLESPLAEYSKILCRSDLDYVGTRLHAGIYALNKGHRTLVISVDNRAECISADTGLPTLPRDAVSDLLREKIYGEIKTELALPWNNIKNFLSGLDYKRG